MRRLNRLLVLAVLLTAQHLRSAATRPAVAIEDVSIVDVVTGTSSAPRTVLCARMNKHAGSAFLVTRLGGEPLLRNAGKFHARLSRPCIVPVCRFWRGPTLRCRLTIPDRRCTRS